MHMVNTLQEMAKITYAPLMKRTRESLRQRLSVWKETPILMENLKKNKNRNINCICQIQCYLRELVNYKQKETIF